MLDTLKRYLRYTSWPIIAAMLGLMVIGVTAIRVSQQADPELQGLWEKQAAFACLAVIAFIAATAVPYQQVGRLAYPLFAATVVILITLFALPPTVSSCLQIGQMILVI